MFITITDFGRILVAMAANIEDDKLKRMLRAGAAKCVEIAKETEPDWVPFDKMVCPLAPEVYVEVKVRDGTTTHGPAWILTWDYPYDNPCRIIAYRVIDKPEPYAYTCVHT